MLREDGQSRRVDVYAADRWLTCADKNVYVFAATNGSLYDTLVGHGNIVTAVAWSPNSRTLASTAGGQRISMGNNQVVEGPDDAVHLWTRR